MQPTRGAPRDDRSAALPAVEDHGRAVSANRHAAAWYRQAQRAADRSEATMALRWAIDADAGFEIALADLEALTGDAVQRPGARLMNWERHHIEVVRVACSGTTERAADLLREHLAGAGCDPLALRIVAYLRDPLGDDDGFLDIRVQLPACHASPWPNST